MGTKKLSAIGEALMGASASVFANAVVHPLDVIAARRQVAAEPSKGQSLFAGLGASLVQSAASSFFYFWIHQAIRRLYNPGTAVELLLGALAGAISRAFTTPISVIATRQQTCANEKSSITLFFEIIRNEGVSKLWSGFPASLVLTVNPALTYGLFERVQGIVLLGRQNTGSTSMSPAESFLVGAITKAIATVVTYPYIMAKVRMQYRSPSMDAAEKGLSDEEKKKREALRYKSATDVLVKRIGAQLLKAVLCQGILFTTKDAFTDLFLNVIG
ncbi:mitochondrial carrier [Rhizoclosmatium globosum]|uniref:Mitochondrial carrier n=1 Tax=Rhizoclosmatium globosum TaxID=329046 RepID=A0A1Y2BQM8_9FUNG|nr:mitochondrial carrier [Rhizoclosmatium globosum]|eukprot:ORY37040.1 mitochondrial carrier [Rhizoclosmatium globosum]